MNWPMLLLVLASIVLLYWLWRQIKARPQAFSKKNIEQSLTTIGLLALLVIVLVTVMVWWLRHYT